MRGMNNPDAEVKRKLMKLLTIENGSMLPWSPDILKLTVEFNRVLAQRFGIKRVELGLKSHEPYTLAPGNATETLNEADARCNFYVCLKVSSLADCNLAEPDSVSLGSYSATTGALEIHIKFRVRVFYNAGIVEVYHNLLIPLRVRLPFEHARQLRSEDDVLRSAFVVKHEYLQRMWFHERQGKPVLWISGPPASGKSVLSRQLVMSAVNWHVPPNAKAAASKNKDSARDRATWRTAYLGSPSTAFRNELQFLQDIISQFDTSTGPFSSVSSSPTEAAIQLDLHDYESVSAAVHQLEESAPWIIVLDLSSEDQLETSWFIRSITALLSLTNEHCILVFVHHLDLQEWLQQARRRGLQELNALGQRLCSQASLFRHWPQALSATEVKSLLTRSFGSEFAGRSLANKESTMVEDIVSITGGHPQLVCLWLHVMSGLYERSSSISEDIFKCAEDKVRHGASRMLQQYEDLEYLSTAVRSDFARMRWCRRLFLYRELRPDSRHLLSKCLLVRETSGHKFGCVEIYRSSQW